MYHRVECTSKHVDVRIQGSHCGRRSTQIRNREGQERTLQGEIGIGAIRWTHDVQKRGVCIQKFLCISICECILLCLCLYICMCINIFLLKESRGKNIQWQWICYTSRSEPLTPFPTKGDEKWMIPGVKQDGYQTSLQHLLLPESTH